MFALYLFINGLGCSGAFFYLISYMPQPPEWQFQGMGLSTPQRERGA